MVKKTASKKKVKKNITKGICHIQCSFNNTIVTFTDTAGNATAWRDGTTVSLFAL